MKKRNYFIKWKKVFDLALIIIILCFFSSVDGQITTVKSNKQFLNTGLNNLSKVNAVPLVAKWDFACENVSFADGEIKVKDLSQNAFTGTLKNGAKIRSFGFTRKFYVLDLGSDNGYFDMGAEIGKYIYTLYNYTIGAYYFISPSYANLNDWGNCLWRFSNSATQSSTGNGVMYCSLKNQGEVLTKTGYEAEFGAKINSNAPLGVWKHIAYTQDGDTGRLFVDGVQKLAVKCTLIPSAALPIAGRIGTLYNTIGYPAYINECFLKKTLVYGFELYDIPLFEADLLDDLGPNVDGTLDALNTSFSEMSEPDITEQQVYNEWSNFSMGTDSITCNTKLPVKGLLDSTVAIQWISNRPDLVSVGGLVTCPDYLANHILLTAMFIKGCHSLKKTFNVTVLPKPANVYKSDLLLNYNFSANLVKGDTVIDAAEKHFKGTLMKGAIATTIFECSGIHHDVLALPIDSAYFDMGIECGKLIYGLNDYSISVYFYINPYKLDFEKNGNFLYTFSNSDNSLRDKNGYIFGRATDATHCVSSAYLANGSMQTLDTLSASEIGVFHHFVYTQKDSVGTVYLDGDTISSLVFTNIPSFSLPKTGFSGTIANFLGRSNYRGDVYLGKAIIADFRLYKRALSFDEVFSLYYPQTESLNKAIGICDGDIKNKNDILRIDNSLPGIIQIRGVADNPKIIVYDLMGRKVLVTSNKTINLNTGIYMVKINNKVMKVAVK